MPLLRQLAEKTQATAALLVAEGEEQVSVAVIVPVGVSYHLSFREGTRVSARPRRGGTRTAGRPATAPR